MNRKLRERHLRVWVLLAAVLPIGFGAAMTVRMPAQALESVRIDPEPGVALGGTGIFGHVIMGDGEKGAALELAAREDPALPDVLVYWSPGEEDELGETRLDGTAILLGSFFGARVHRYALPPAAVGESEPHGRVILYSLAHAQVVGARFLTDLRGASDGS